MINFITGHVKEIQDQSITIDIGNVGIALFVPEVTTVTLNQNITLWTYMHWNQDSGPSLFGFHTVHERTVFLLIIGCSGIGPKIALSIIAQLGPEQFLRAVHSADESALSKVSGIGTKKAEQMIVQLKHKVAKLVESGAPIIGGQERGQWQTVTQVLQSLNYSRTEITAATRYLHEQYAQEQLSFDQLMRHALSFLAKKP